MELMLQFSVKTHYYFQFKEGLVANLMIMHVNCELLFIFSSLVNMFCNENINHPTWYCQPTIPPLWRSLLLYNKTLCVGLSYNSPCQI